MAIFTSAQVNPNSSFTFFFPPSSTSHLLHSTFRNREFRLWKKRRLKRNSKLLRNALEPSSTSASSALDFLSLLPLNWVPPAALGFASAFALSYSKYRNNNLLQSNSNSGSESNSDSRVSDVGEWILFTSPTPFNRFVLLRCPSISFENGEEEDVSERLVKEEKHFVRLDSGRIQLSKNGGGEAKEERENGVLEYQRVCVGTEDGGVISLDWPCNLDLSDERGLDTTVLLIPGTANGSMDENVRSFVRECLRRGLFPVVMNPRGCAGSPLTTARLFTAADSDDICSAIQFITKARPRSTLTGVGLGYGANMLTKYLAEAGEKTPLTAATCIDNPFDLDEATRTSPYCNIIDDKLTGGLIDILKSNKELFQGRRKGFDVEKALAAESVRDFEEAISMVSFGFDSLEDFYSNSSTRKLVGNLKVPVLFVQNDTGTVPLFSIPRGSIAENPFTSLLLCSFLPSTVNTISWYQHVATEWLTAVELGILKGRHPLLQDIDVTVKPSKGLALVEGRTSDTSGRVDRLLNLAKLDNSDVLVDPMKGMRRETDTLPSIHSKLNQNSKGSSDDEDSTKVTETNPVESDSGQVLPTAQVVMNMLDVTMPGTLKEEDKKKVLSAVDRGETLIKALQDAVPEDVRGKLTTSVSEILQAPGKNMNLNTLLSINHKADPSSALKSDNKENAALRSDSENENIDRPSENRVSGDAKPDNSDNNLGEEATETKVVDSNEGDTRLTEGLKDSQNSDEKPDNDASAKNVDQPVDSGGDGSDATAKINSSSGSGGSTNSEAGVKPSTWSQDDETKQAESDISEIVGESKDLPEEQNKTSSDAEPAADTDEATPPPTSDSQISENGNGDGKTKGEDLQPLPDQNSAPESKSPTFSVSQAFDAFTGMDDSTQVAVNSVFGVLEDMITQLEEKSTENIVNEESENKDAINGSVVEKDGSTSELHLEKQMDGKDKENTNPLDIESVHAHDSNGSMKMGPTAASGKEKNIEMLNLIVNNPGAANVKAFDKEFVPKYILSKMQKVKDVAMDATTAPLLDYVPEDGHLLLLKQPGGIHVAVFDNKDKKEHTKLPQKENVIDNVIEPSYVILDKETQDEPTEELMQKSHDKSVKRDNVDRSKLFVKTTLLNSLKVEVSRRLNATDIEDMDAALAADMEAVAEAVYLAIQHEIEHNQELLFSGLDPDFQEWSRLINGDLIVEAISKVLQDTSYLKKVLPIGVIVGSTLASLRNCFDVAAGALDMDQDQFSVLKPDDILPQEVIQLPIDGIDLTPEKNLTKVKGSGASDGPGEDDVDKEEFKGLDGNTLMVGAVTAALGASALLTSQQDDFMANDGYETDDKHMKSESVHKEETVDDKDQSNIVTSLAEKAMSVAGPVVPTTQDGAVDQDRIVAMLAGLGQRGGALRLVGKLALLWGGLRGAMSLTDKLFSFLRIADQPLFLRVLGFSGMVLVLWSPVLVPLLPTLFQNLLTHTSSSIVELACIVGLYTAVIILIMQWGKGIRGYEDPFKQYGLDFTSPRKVQHFLIGLVGGVMLVISIHSLNAYLGFVKLSFPSSLGSSSLTFSAKIKAHGQLFLSAGQGLAVAAGVSFVEELLFRSWLLEEIAIDLGYHPGILLSGLAFALSQRSWQAIPGLWLLSLCLAGARLRKEGSLFIPIGLRTGLMASSYFLQTSGFVVYMSKIPWWIIGLHPFQPFSGVVGLLVALLLAVALYPRQPRLKEGVSRTIRA
ncbi:uncharacterized protein LOC110721832 [Chenopodium quinoa]|uniref:uncharacterized protein LOC110721832 n=1 Tax=Chenopodium quinoa TaxID=63459 RepID=UPI000B78AE43|nr:uncharacterized protein LOC110721832 [Chenopodium quinoa]